MGYNIKQGNTVTGSMNVQINKSENGSFMKLETPLKTGSVLTIAVNTKEECLFENEVLKCSRVCREVNGIEKPYKKHCSYGSRNIKVSKEKAGTFCCTFTHFDLMNRYNSEQVGLNNM